jgi:hypothetical protein
MRVTTESERYNQQERAHELQSERYNQQENEHEPQEERYNQRDYQQQPEPAQSKRLRVTVYRISPTRYCLICFCVSTASKNLALSQDNSSKGYAKL